MTTSFFAEWSPVKKFWVCFVLIFILFAVLVLSIFLRGARTAPDVWDEDAYIANILALEPIDPPLYAKFADTEEIFRAHPNLIVRCRADSRATVGVYDPFGKYTIDDLMAGGLIAGCASAYIATPYRMEIEEVYLGDPDIFSKGDTFWYYAQYGDIPAATEAGSEYHYIRYENYPVLRVDTEYIMFFNVWKIGETLWFDLTSPGTVLEITDDPNSFRTPSPIGEPIFAAYKNTTALFLADLERLLTEYPCVTDVPTIEPYGATK